MSHGTYTDQMWSRLHDIDDHLQDLAHRADPAEREAFAKKHREWEQVVDHLENLGQNPPKQWAIRPEGTTQ